MQNAPANPQSRGQFSRNFEADVMALRPALNAQALHFCRNRFDADDLVQETLCKAFRYHDRYQPGTKLKSWLFTIMSNQFRTEYGLRRREPVMAEKLQNHLISAAAQDWIVCGHEAERIIDLLPDQQRSALLQVSSGISYQDAATSLGCEIGTIKSRVSRARRTLAAVMGPIFTNTYA